MIITLGISESDLLQTKLPVYLGLSDLSISDITKWPLASRKAGSAIPVRRHLSRMGDITVTNVKIDTATSKLAQVFAEAGINLRFHPAKQDLVYHFTCTAGRMAERFTGWSPLPASKLYMRAKMLPVRGTFYVLITSSFPAFSLSLQCW